MKKLAVVAAILIAVIGFAIVTDAAPAVSQYFSSIYVRTLLQVSGKAIITDSLRSQGPLILNGALDATNKVAKIDSFYTTSTSDTIAVSGIAVGDIFVFAEYTPLYSTTADTCTFSYQTKTDTCFVYRWPVERLTADVKSNGLYSWIRIK